MLLIIGLLVSVLFSAVAIILVVGMIPTLVAAIVDRTKGRVRTLTVGSVNLAGCAPFIAEILKRGNDMTTAINYVIQPRTIVVMYMAAGMGYLIDWAMTGIVSSVMVQRAKGRLQDIENQQKGLVERWGMEVTGTIPLDEFGFSKELPPPKEAE